MTTCRIARAIASRNLGAAIILSFALCNKLAVAQTDNFYVTTNTLLARSIGLGGAYTAVVDEIASTLYNPANAGGYHKGHTASFKIFLNPWTPIVASADRSAIFSTEESNGRKALATILALLKGLSYRGGPFDLVLILGEQSTYERLLALQSDFISMENYLDNQYSTAAVRFRLADRAAIGGSLGFFRHRLSDFEGEWSIRASYGITLAPAENVHVGVSYIRVPQALEDSLSQVDIQHSYRGHAERLIDGSLNIGVSYRPVDKLLLALDFRNLVEDQSAMVREPHFGIEYAISQLFGIRAGSFMKNREKLPAFTFGIGLFDRFKRRSDQSLVESNWVLNYGLVLERLADSHRRITHALTIGFALGFGS